MSSKWIYIVEDDKNIREMEQYALENSGFQVKGFDDGKSFFKECEETLPGLIILDIMLPGEDGMSILKLLRASPRTAGIPVMMVTAKDSELDKVKGLDLGADDYMAKPFGVLELVSRSRALLRRAERIGREEQEREASTKCGTIEMSDDRHQVLVDGEKVELTYKEYELLQVVGHTPMDKITRKGNVISCDVFSTYRDGRPIGTQEFLLLDTESWEYCGIKG